MRLATLCLLLSCSAFPASGADTLPTESAFRTALGINEKVRIAYRALDCRTVTYREFTEAMLAPGVNSEVERALDGTEVTVTARRRGAERCPSPYPDITELPAFDLRDLAGKRVTDASLKGKPTLINFYFAQCVPCILEVEPINRYAAHHPEMNFLAMTSDESPVARDFVTRHKFHWRVVPDAQEFIDRLRVKQYPMMALFDSRGRLLGTRIGGARDALEAANVVPQLSRWVDGLLRADPRPTP